MSCSNRALLAAISFALAGCSTVPSLEQASGTPATDILIHQIVKRVKCEIADAFSSRINDPHYLWMADWTAKVDLTLQANVLAGISPNVAYTSFFKNAFNYAAGSTSLTQKTIQAVNQSFSVSAGAAYGEQAIRSEVVSFTVSLRELARWKMEVEREEANYPDGQRICVAVNGTELNGGLGLQEWVNSALYPVEISDLRAGYHPSPVSISKPAISASSPKPAFAGEDTKIGLDEALKRVGDANTASKAAVSSAAKSLKVIEDYSQQLRKAIAPFMAALDPKLKADLLKSVSDLDGLDVQAKAKNTLVASFAVDVSTEYNGLKQLRDSGQGSAQILNKEVVLAEFNSAEAVKAQGDVGKLEEAATKIVQPLRAINPPIDAILHSVTFVISYGANVAPGWSLLQWKGPSPATGSLAAASGQQTHLLNIAIGPVGGQEQNRLINNQTILNSNATPRQ